ncbi:type IX secretion system outer membrane channel protein PorV [Marinoscillum sp. MHG1-6]|uniref:type IX secretion system outer membrane channel protein PorV n=1 Tax=Marinoscillum sp. MHG1-6 TaxID=2959627 RepID=UPI0021575E75|nr:type IX secretion system outer membrane channel protein PorV [Marinoscillum sp. MHG1-6]
MKYRLFRIILIAAGFTPLALAAQTNNQKITGQDDGRNPITVAVPFVSFAPDSRGSALGDAGVASSPDVYSNYWNSAKLAFIEKDLGVSFSYSPWLGKIINDMSLNYLTFYKRIDRIQSFGFSFRYFDLGEIQLTSENGDPLNIENPYELALDGTYSRKLTEKMSVGVTGRFIWSNIAGNITGNTDAKAGTSVAVDIGYYYKQPIIFSGTDSELAFGATLSNFGQKINYSNESNEDFIPTTLRLGSAFKSNLDPYNSITLLLDFSKLLVPTPPIYELDNNGDPVIDPSTGEFVIAKGKDPNRTLMAGTFGSFGDAPDGFVEEMQEVMISVGAEYNYQDVFAVRIGYFTESKNKGDRKFFTAGVGFKYQVFGVDFSYLVPQKKDHPLGDTLRLSFQFNMDKNES